MTNYEFAAVRVIPIGVHMVLDVMVGVFVFIAPWLLHYRVFLTPGQESLHYLLGLGVFALVGLTREKTEAEKGTQGVKIRTHQPAAGRL